MDNLLTRLRRKLGKIILEQGESAFLLVERVMISAYKTGINRTVSVKLPILPAKKVHASHYPMPSQHLSSPGQRVKNADLQRVIP